MVDHKRARVRVRSAEAGKFHVYIYRAGRSGIGHEVIGRRGVEFSEAGVQDFSVPIDVESLRHRDEAWLLATVFWKDSLGNQLGLASDSKKLT